MKLSVVKHVEVSELTDALLDAVNDELHEIGQVCVAVGETRTNVDVLDEALGRGPIANADAAGCIAKAYDMATDENVEEIVFCK